MAWWPLSRRNRHPAPFTRVGNQDLDLIKPPQYEISPLLSHEQARIRVKELVDSIGDGLDAGSRDVLNNLINAWTDEGLAELDSHRDERKAVADALVGLAAEQVARYEPPYLADLAKVEHTAAALLMTYGELTGEAPRKFVPPSQPRDLARPIESTVGSIEPAPSTTSPRPANPGSASPASAGPGSASQGPAGHTSAAPAGGGGPGRSMVSWEQATDRTGGSHDRH